MSEWGINLSLTPLLLHHFTPWQPIAAEIVERFFSCTFIKILHWSSTVTLIYPLSSPIYTAFLRLRGPSPTPFYPISISYTLSLKSFYSPLEALFLHCFCPRLKDLESWNHNLSKLNQFSLASRPATIVQLSTVHRYEGTTSQEITAHSYYPPWRPDFFNTNKLTRHSLTLLYSNKPFPTILDLWTSYALNLRSFYPPLQPHSYIYLFTLSEQIFP